MNNSADSGQTRASSPIPPPSDAPKSANSTPNGALDAQSADKSVDDKISDSSTPSLDPKDVKVEEKQPDKLAPKFAALSKKERFIVAKQQELKASEAKLAESKAKMESEFAQERAKINSEMEKVNKFESLKKMNALEAMKELGFTYEQLTDIVLNEGKPTTEQLFNTKTAELEAKIEALKQAELDKTKDFEAKAKQAEEAKAKALEEEKLAAEKQQQETIVNFQKHIIKHLDDNKELYELIHTNGYQDSVYSVIEEQYQQNGRVMDVSEAAEAVENYLEEQIQKNLATNKLKAKVSSPTAPKESPEASNKANATEQEPKTLNNEMTSASSNKSPALSEEERFKRALERLSGVRN